MTAVLPNAILAKHPGMPMKSLWEALNDKTLGSLEVAMAIVNDPRCGIERRSEVREGAMKNQAFNYTLNNEVGGATPLILAALAGRADVMEALLSLNPTVDAKEDRFGYTALHCSAIMSHLSSMELLIAKGSDVNVVAKYGNTPLHLAARNGNLEAIELLLAKGSDVEAADKIGCTPLHTASSNGKLDAIELLISLGGDIETIDEDGYTPLHTAALLGKLDVIEMLAANGSNVTAATKNGNTPLHTAARNGNLEAIELLMANGSDTEFVNNYGDTPLSNSNFHVGLTA